MKKLAILVFIPIIFLTSCHLNKKPVDMSQCVIDYGNSKIYSQEELNEGINVIKNEFSQLYDHTVYSIKYTTDEESLSELNYYNPSFENRFTECMVFSSDFKCPPYDTEVRSKNEEIYDWKWVLAREKDGEWTVIASGLD